MSVGSVCQYPASSGDPYNHGWCTSSYEQGDVVGTDVATVGTEVCRQTAGVTEGVLNFASAQEMEVTIRDQRGRIVWRWSDTLRIGGAAHSLRVAQGVCYRWTTTWNGTSSDGTLLASGTYTASATIVSPNNGNLTTISSIDVRR